MPFRQQGRIDKSRTDRGGRILGFHVPSKSREGDTSQSDNVPYSVSVVSPAINAMVVGAKVQFSATVENKAGTPLSGVAVGWSSSAPQFITIDGNGLATAVAVGGPATITATINNLASSSPAITVVAPPADLTPTQIILPAATTGIAGTSVQLTAIVENAENQAIAVPVSAWHTSNGSNATVSSTGLVAFVAAGTANITATITSPSVTSNTCVATTTANNVAFSMDAISPASTSLQTGNTQQFTTFVRNKSGVVLTSEVVTWSSNSGHLTINSSTGLATAVSAGTAIITATDGSLTQSTQTITVLAPPPDTTPASMTISPTSLSGSSGTGQLTATIDNAEGVVLPSVSPSSWSSTNTSVATVNSSGLVTLVAPGTATIIAHLNSPSLTSNQCVVTVTPTPPPVGVNYAKADFETILSGNVNGTFTVSPNGSQFLNPYGAGMDVIADPTGSGRGNVLRIHYHTDAPGDSNLAIYPLGYLNGTGIGLGGEIWFTGDFYVGPGFASSGVQRKLCRFERDTSQSGFPNPLENEITSIDEQFYLGLEPPQLWGTNASATNGPTNYYYFNEPPFLTPSTWHTLKMHQKVNTTYGDGTGLLQWWLDGTLILNQPSEWIDPTWPSLSGYGFRLFQVGFQCDAGNFAIDEYRYWDNLSWASTESAL